MVGLGSIIEHSTLPRSEEILTLFVTALNDRYAPIQRAAVIGVAKFLNNHNVSSDKIDDHKSYITVYVAGPNLFNTIGKQIKDPIQISVKTSNYSCKYSKLIKLSEFFKYSKEQHDSMNIFEAFNPKSGKPYSIVSYKKWPTMKEAHQLFASQCTFASDPKDLFDSFDIPEISNSELTNSDRFRLLANKESQSGNKNTASTYKKMANQLDAAVKFLGDLNFNDNGNNNAEKFKTLEPQEQDSGTAKYATIFEGIVNQYDAAISFLGKLEDNENSENN